MATLNATSSISVTLDYQLADTLQTCMAKPSVSISSVYKDSDTGLATLASKKYIAAISIANGAANTTVNFTTLADGFGTNTNMTKCKVLHVECSSGAGLVNANPASALASALWGAAGTDDGLTKPIKSGQKWHEESTTNTGFACTNQAITFQNTNTGSTFACTLVLIGD